MRSIFILLFLIPSLCNAFDVTLIPHHDACGNGTGRIEANVSGGSAPYSFLWTPAPAIGQGTSMISGLFPGEYTVVVTDTDGVQIMATETIDALPGLYPGDQTDLVALSCDTECNGTASYQTASGWGGQPPYNVEVSPGGFGNPNFNALELFQLCPGTTYTATVTDALGCASVFSGIDVIDLDYPVLQSMDIVGTCVGGSTGSVTLTFDQPLITVEFFNFGGLPSWFTQTFDGVVVLPNLGIGTYSATAYPFIADGSEPGPGPCGVPIFFDIPFAPDPCGSISGTVFVDFNSDCLMNSDDVPFPELVLDLDGQGYVITSPNGTYSRALLNGDHTITSDAPDYDPLCPNYLPAPFTVNADSADVVLDIALDPLIGPDIQISCMGGPARPGFAMWYNITVRNTGPYTHEPFTVTFNYDFLLTFDSSSVTPDQILPGSLEFSIPALAAWQQFSIQMHFELPPDPMLIGASISASSAIDPVFSDWNPENNTCTTDQEIVGAYDPNDKLVRTSSDVSNEYYYIESDEHVDYTIRFQNTGNAEAFNVYLIDTISTEHDLGSLQILGTSHAYEVQLLPERVLRFDFPDIMLPDSASDPLGSQGFASFRLKPHNGLMIGDVLENFADIYFDFNPPIRTNTSELIVGTSTSIVTSKEPDQLMAWPNPAGDNLNVRFNDGAMIDGWRMYDALGRVVAASEKIWPDAFVTISLGGLPKGTYHVEIHSGEKRTFTRVVKVN